MNLLVDCAETQEGVAHRPAKLYKFDRKRYNKLVAQGFNFELKESRLTHQKDLPHIRMSIL